MGRRAVMEKATAVEPTNNDGKQAIEQGAPYTARVEILGTAPFLFHRWSNEAVEAKAKAAKNSKAKKEDDLESYVYRNDKGMLSIPGEYFRQSVIHAAKYRQDPRSPRKSAMDLFKAGVVCVTELCSLGAKEWDYIDRRRVLIQRNAVTRARPAILSGWKVVVDLLVLTPEYIASTDLLDTLTQAGRLIGVGDFRPTFGRFQVTKFDLLR
jgi:hypothetical protein